MKLSRLQGYTKPRNINKHYDRIHKERNDEFVKEVLYASFLIVGITLLMLLPYVSEWFTNNILNK